MPEFEAIKEGITGSFFNRDDIQNLAEAINRWFEKNGQNRDEVRENCMNIIDKEWNPYYQIEILKKGLGL